MVLRRSFSQAIGSSTSMTLNDGIMLTLHDRGRNLLRILSETEEDTREFGRKLSASLKPGAVVALIGDLGAGKTRLVQAIAEAFEVPIDEVNSPTFTLVQEYSGQIPLRHCDTYRLREADEFLDLGLDELFARDGIGLVEWADRVEEFMPRDVIRISIRITSPTSREFQLEGTGPRSQRMLQQLEESWDLPIHG